MSSRTVLPVKGVVSGWTPGNRHQLFSLARKFNTSRQTIMRVRDGNSSQGVWDGKAG